MRRTREDALNMSSLNTEEVLDRQFLSLIGGCGLDMCPPKAQVLKAFTPNLRGDGSFKKWGLVEGS